MLELSRPTYLSLLRGNISHLVLCDLITAALYIKPTKAFPLFCPASRICIIWALSSSGLVALKVETSQDLNHHLCQYGAMR